MKPKEIKERFDKIEERLDKLVENKIGKESFRLLKIFESKPRYAFSVNEILKKGFSNAYYYLNKLIKLRLVDRKWLRTEYKYYLVSEWNRK